MRYDLFVQLQFRNARGTPVSAHCTRSGWHFTSCFLLSTSLEVCVPFLKTMTELCVKLFQVHNLFIPSTKNFPLYKCQLAWGRCEGTTQVFHRHNSFTLALPAQRAQWKVTVKLYSCIPWRHMRGAEVFLHSFWTSEWSALRPSRFASLERDPVPTKQGASWTREKSVALAGIGTPDSAGLLLYFDSETLVQAVKLHCCEVYCCKCGYFRLYKPRYSATVYSPQFVAIFRNTV